MLASGPTKRPRQTTTSYTYNRYHLASYNLRWCFDDIYQRLFDFNEPIRIEAPPCQ